MKGIEIEEIIENDPQCRELKKEISKRTVIGLLVSIVIAILYYITEYLVILLITALIIGTWIAFAIDKYTDRASEIMKQLREE